MFPQELQKVITTVLLTQSAKAASSLNRVSAHDTGLTDLVFDTGKTAPPSRARARQGRRLPRMAGGYQGSRREPSIQGRDIPIEIQVRGELSYPYV
jgi:hypothetical protein